MFFALDVHKYTASIYLHGVMTLPISFPFESLAVDKKRLVSMISDLSSNIGSYARGQASNESNPTII